MPATYIKSFLVEYRYAVIGILCLFTPNDHQVFSVRGGHPLLPNKSLIGARMPIRT